MHPRNFSLSGQAAYMLALHRAFYHRHALLPPLLRKYGSAEAVFATAPELVNSGQLPHKIGIAINNPDWRGVENDLAWLASDCANFILILYGNSYPDLLQQIADPPTVLFGRGNKEALFANQIAVVGSRRASTGGLRRAARLATELVHSNFAVTSGMAVGIDGSAHKAAVAAGGVAVAVLGSGVDNVYPGCHCRLAEQIIASAGAVVSEFAIGAPPLPGHFPRRNRIISGLSKAVVVVEAAMGSGSLITARLAAEQGREVLAVPGSPDNPLSSGCHSLLRDGAGLVEDVADVLAALGFGQDEVTAYVAPAQLDVESLSPTMKGILAKVDYQSTSIESIARGCGLTVSKVSSMLFALEEKGYVVLQLDGNYCRVR